jgi:hypothetical protein
VKRDPLAFPSRPEAGKRSPPTLRERLASALLDILELRGQGIPYATAKEMTTTQILALFEVDHWPIRHIDGGTNHPSNLRHRLIQEHRSKTAKVDIPQIRKGIRLAAAHDAGIAKMRAKILGTPAPKPERKKRWNSRPLTGRSNWPKKGVRVKNRFS